MHPPLSASHWERDPTPREQVAGQGTHVQGSRKWRLRCSHTSHYCYMCDSTVVGKHLVLSSFLEYDLMMTAGDSLSQVVARGLIYPEFLHRGASVGNIANRLTSSSLFDGGLSWILLCAFLPSFLRVWVAGWVCVDNDEDRVTAKNMLMPQNSAPEPLPPWSREASRCNVSPGLATSQIQPDLRDPEAAAG